MAVLVKFLKFNLAGAVRPFPYIGMSAWPLASREDADWLIRSQPASQGVIVEIARDDQVFACPWGPMDRYIIGESNDYPRLVPFEPTVHINPISMASCPCGCGADDGPAMNLDWQIVLVRPRHVQQDRAKRLWNETRLLAEDLRIAECDCSRCGRICRKSRLIVQAERREQRRRETWESFK